MVLVGYCVWQADDLHMGDEVDGTRIRHLTGPAALRVQAAKLKRRTNAELVAERKVYLRASCL